jgi:hypothetical protein
MPDFFESDPSPMYLQPVDPLQKKMEAAIAELFETYPLPQRLFLTRGRMKELAGAAAFVGFYVVKDELGDRGTSAS